MNENLIPGMCRDANPGQGVQPWSAGDIFPLVIERVEQYGRGVSGALDGGPLLLGAYWNVLNAGEDMSGYASYDEARAGALGWLAAQRRQALAKRPVGEVLVEIERGRFVDGSGALVDFGNGSGVL